MMEKAQESFTAPLKESQEEMSSINIPEESDESLSIGYDHRVAVELPSSSYKAAAYCPAQHEVFKRSPCELDESGSFSFYPGDRWYETEPASYKTTASSAGRMANSCTPEGNISHKVSNSPTGKLQIMIYSRGKQSQRVEGSTVVTGEGFEIC